MVAVIVCEGALLWMIVVTFIGTLAGIHDKKSVVAHTTFLASLIVIYVTLIRHMPIIKDISETL